MGSVREYPASLAEVIDGDTYDLFVDLGDDLRATWRVRLKGVDAPDRKYPDKWATATMAVTALLNIGGPFPLTLRTTQTGKGSAEREKFGRYLAAITLPDGRDLAAVMVGMGCAVPWYGKGPHPVPA